MHARFCLFFIALTPRPSHNQDISPLVDVKTLSELPLEKLLHVQNTFNEPEIQEIEAKISTAPSSTSPEALALQAKRNPSDRGGYATYHYEEHSKKSGKKSVQSIFQISVTALAFLAFGGYLLCLLIQAIKGKSVMMMEVTTMAPMTAAAAAFLRPRPVRRRRPLRKPVKVQKPTRQSLNKNRKPAGVRAKREIWPQADPENMYYALVHLSEAYATYHTIDFRKFNYSSKSYVN